jgi:hypothetical protein
VAADEPGEAGGDHHERERDVEQEQCSKGDTGEADQQA